MLSKQRTYISLLLFSVVIGVLAAFGALLFRSLIEMFHILFWGAGIGFMDLLIAADWWMKLLIPCACGTLAGFFIVYLVPEARGPGVPEVILSVTTRESTIRHRVTFFKALVTSLLIGAGASVGREGPIVQIGASVGSSAAQILGLRPELRRTCLAAGAAAGIAATFNAPIAGTLFAIEVILMDLDLSYISHIVIAAVVGSVVSRLFLGNFPAFQPPPFALVHHWELLIYLLLGIAGGMVAILFIRMISVTDSLFFRLPVPEWSKPGIGGLLLGLMALRMPYALGVGYESINAALNGTLLLEATFFLIIAKMAATSLCIGSGMSGGIFAPSLVLGATLGTALSLGLNRIIPGMDLMPAHYALAGMGAVVAGTTLAPITAILTIFELTYDEQVILPLMVTCIASIVVVRLFFGYSAYEMRLLKQGVSIVRGHDVGILRNLYARDFMDREFESLPAGAPLETIVERILTAPFPHFVVLDSEEKLAGVLSLEDVKNVLGRIDVLRHLVVTADLMTRDVVTLSERDNLETALARFEDHDISFLPVITPREPGKVIGILKKDELLRAYRERVLMDRILSMPVR